MVEVSIVIVCMNNLKNLYPCLDSIKKHTQVTYETFVVAYLFSKENLEKVKKDYPWVIFIESNEIRGFSENNNLALRQAKGKYSYILNDDTFIDSPVIDNLVNSLDTLPGNVAVLSPDIRYPDGRPQFCGRNVVNFWTFFKSSLGLKCQDSQYSAKLGVFETFNLMGAAFLIKTEIFKSIGFFDEFYFFCPEDLVVSTILRKKGYKCYVNGDIVQYHIQGGTWSMMQTATEPAHYQGSISFYSENSQIKKFILILTYSIRFLIRYIVWFLINVFTKNEKARIKKQMYINIIKGINSNETPKDLFITHYNKLR